MLVHFQVLLLIYLLDAQLANENNEDARDPFEDLGDILEDRQD
jgi:hypothetical protein